MSQSHLSVSNSHCANVPQEGCYCVDRWVERNRKDVEVGNTTASHLAVQYPADLAWFDVTCHVLDQKTLKQKQVGSVAQPTLALPKFLHRRQSIRPQS